jgi:hypothetical protein
MSFQLDDLIRRFPFAYHLTARANLARIRKTGQLESAAALMRVANRVELLRVRRAGLMEIDVNGEAIILRDQAPLHTGHTDLQGGWDFPRFVESLNSQVFFWPGGEEEPIPHGQRHFQRYESQGPAILRVRLRDLIASNPDRAPLFCPYNSGSPRTVGGKKSPRGPSTFLPCDQFERNYQHVVEVTFHALAVLPVDVTEVRFESDGLWQPLSVIAADPKHVPKVAFMNKS